MLGPRSLDARITHLDGLSSRHQRCSHWLILLRQHHDASTSCHQTKPCHYPPCCHPVCHVQSLEQGHTGWEGRVIDNLDHLVCDCDPNTALCGTDVTRNEWAPEPEPGEGCLVCTDLAQYQCPQCGIDLND